MGITLATRMQKIKPSPTLAVAEKAAKLKAEGHKPPPASVAKEYVHADKGKHFAKATKK